MTSACLIPAQADQQHARRRDPFHLVYERLPDDRISPLFYLPGKGLLGLDADGTGTQPHDGIVLDMQAQLRQQQEVVL